VHWYLPVRLSALALLAVSLGFGAGSLSLGLWSNGIPGPGLTTFIGSLLLLPISVGLLRANLGDEDREPLRWTSVFGAIAFAVYVVAWQVVGFVAATFLLLVVWVRGLHGQKWIAAGITAVTVCLAIGFLFVRLLNVPLSLWPG
jgi:hypothetical protein